MRNKVSQARGNRHKLYALVLFLLVAVLLAGCGGDDKKADQTPKNDQPVEVTAIKPEEFPAVVAEFKNGKVTNREFATSLNLLRFFNDQYEQREAEQGYREMMLESYISTKLVVNELTADENANVEKKAEERLNQLEKDANKQLGAEGFNNRLKQFGLKREDVTAYLQDSLRITTFLERNLTDDVLKKAYQDGLKNDEFTRATVSHILIGTKVDPNKPRTDAEALKIANEVIKKLKGGEDFAALAKQYSEDPGSKDNGGEYKDEFVAKWVPEFKAAALTLPLNKVSEPVKTDYGYHVMKVTKRDPPLAFELVKEELLREQKQANYEMYIQTEVRSNITKNNLTQPGNATQQK